MITRLRAARLPLSLTAIAFLTLHLPASVAEPGTPAAGGAAGNIVAHYNVRLGNFNLGHFSFTTTLRGSVYEMRGEGRFKVLQGLLYEWKGATASAGRVTNSGPQPSMYAFNFAAGRQGEQLRVTFSGNRVSQISKNPERPLHPRVIPVTKDQLDGVLDPLSAAFLVARSDNPNGDLEVCKQTVPVFDGHQRYDLELRPKRVANVERETPTGYAGPAAVCGVRFVPISGHHPQNPGIKMMSETKDIEVWLVPLGNTSMYVPYRVVLPTLAGQGIATSTHFEVRGVENRRAALGD
jgi:hypothetical protein